MPGALATAIEEACGVRIDPAGLREVGGGSINRSCVVDSDAGRLFLKINAASCFEMFAAEAEGLAELAGAAELRVPRVHGFGIAGGDAWLAMECLELGRADEACRRRLGEGLAALHRHTADAHGWHRDNTIGSTPQPNRRDPDWVRFLGEQRIGHQLDLAAGVGAGDLLEDGHRLLERLGEFFTDYRPVPSLLHGDLWGGNFGAVGGEPVIFDPAVYFGDRETDIAMTELFGGFGAAFYEAYRSAWPLDPGYEIRRDLYQLYHVLNHLNLFGGAYLGQARSLIGRLLAA